MADVVSGEAVIGLSRKELTALAALLDAQENLDPALNDLNNTVQTL